MLVSLTHCKCHILLQTFHAHGRPDMGFEPAENVYVPVSVAQHACRGNSSQVDLSLV